MWIIDMQIYPVGIDLGKTTFHLVALGAAGNALVKKKFRQVYGRLYWRRFESA
jgi:hypothetical protein